MKLPRALLYPLQRVIYHERFRLLDQLLSNQQMDRKSLQQKQHHDLAALLKYAVERVPYYHQQLGTMDWDSFPESLPILHKSDLIQHRDALLDHCADRTAIQLGHTGGSTGRPIAYYYDQHKIELMRAGHYRSFMQCGWRPGEQILQLWGATQDLQSRPSLSKQIEQTLSAEEVIGAYQFDEATLQQWSNTLRKVQPVVIRGYPSILEALARYLIDQKIEPPPTIKGCFSTAETLYSHQREKIEQALQCKVYNQYGSREIPNISCECSHGSQHVFTDLVWLESLEVEGIEQLVVTSLTNRLQPLIRYAIGDTGTLQEEACTCGSPFPTMEMGICRSNDLIHTPEGRQVYPSHLIHLLDGFEGIDQFQFTQERIGQITLQLEVEQALPLSETERLQTLFHEQISPTLSLEIETVETINRGGSGKHRFVRCNLP